MDPASFEAETPFEIVPLSFQPPALRAATFVGAPPGGAPFTFTAVFAFGVLFAFGAEMTVLGFGGAVEGAFFEKMPPIQLFFCGAARPGSLPHLPTMVSVLP